MGRWTLYALSTVVDLTFLLLALQLCNGEVSPVRVWLLVKSAGAMGFRCLLFLEFAANLSRYLELRNRLAARDYRLKHQLIDPTTPWYDWLPFIFAVFEVACVFGTTKALLSRADRQPCHSMVLAASTSTAITFFKYVTCIYAGCLQCCRRDQE